MTDASSEHPHADWVRTATQARDDVDQQIDTVLTQLHRVQALLAEHSPDAEVSQAEEAARQDIRTQFARSPQVAHLEAILATVRRRRYAAQLAVAAAALELVTHLLVMQGPGTAPPVQTPAPLPSSPRPDPIAARLATFLAEVQHHRRVLLQTTGWFESHYVTRGVHRYGPYRTYRFRVGGVKQSLSLAERRRDDEAVAE